MLTKECEHSVSSSTLVRVQVNLSAKHAVAAATSSYAEPVFLYCQASRCLILLSSFSSSSASHLSRTLPTMSGDAAPPPMDSLSIEQAKTERVTGRSNSFSQQSRASDDSQTAAEYVAIRTEESLHKPRRKFADKQFLNQFPSRPGNARGRCPRSPALCMSRFSGLPRNITVTIITVDSIANCTSYP